MISATIQSKIIEKHCMERTQSVNSGTSQLQNNG